MRIMVLGATGFLGRNVAERLVRSGHDVHGICHVRPAYEGSINWHSADLRHPDAFDYDGFDVVIQLAACSSGCRDTLNDPSVHTANNSVMNAYILPNVVKSKVKHFIFPSCSVMLPNGKNTEDAQIAVRKEYAGFAWVKVFYEKMCEFYAGLGDTKFTVVRNSNFYGPYDKFDLKHSHVFGATMTKVLTATDKVMVWGTGEEARDLVYVGDFCDFIEALIVKQEEKFEIVNCGYGEATTINDLVNKIIVASGKNLKVEHDLSAPTIPTTLSLDNSKAKKLLGWEPKTTLEQGIRLTMDWWKDNVGVL